MMSNRDVIQLIHLYKENECLWNINSNLFRRTDLKNNAYRKIAADMNMDEIVIRKKLKNLRTAYATEKKKILNSKKSGAGLEEIKESSLFYFDDMAFLDPCIIYRTGKSNLSESVNNSDELSQPLTESTQSRDYSASDDCYSEGVINDYEMNAPPKRRRIFQQNSPGSNFDDALNKFISAVNSEPVKDQFKQFAQAIAAQLRQIPEMHAVRFMGSMHQQITELRMSLFDPIPTASCPLPVFSPSSSSSSSGVYSIGVQPQQVVQQTRNIPKTTLPFTSNPPSTSSGAFSNAINRGKILQMPLRKVPTTCSVPLISPSSSTSPEPLSPEVQPFAIATQPQRIILTPYKKLKIVPTSTPVKTSTYAPENYAISNLINEVTTNVNIDENTTF